jgi:hypothetical protein
MQENNTRADQQIILVLFTKRTSVSKKLFTKSVTAWKILILKASN